MNNFKLSERSLKNMKGVHPDLLFVVLEAIKITPYDFGITNGVRAYELQEMLVATGKSKTMDSLHLIQPDGYAHAFDFVVYVNGKITWQHKYYRKVIQTMFEVAIEHGIQIEAGGLWRDFLDSPHIQLNQKYYGV